jgi:two-component system nitrate/nitrite response regulator NarL
MSLPNEPDPAPGGSPRDALRVVIASDVRLYREGLARILAERPEIELAGTAPLAFAAERAALLRPRLLLADSAAVRAGRLVADVSAACAETLVVAFAVEEREKEVVACAEAGAAAYVPRDASVVEMVEILVGAANGEVRASPRMAAGVFRRVGVLAAEGKARAEGPPLTEREAEVRDLVARGLSNKQIAGRLSIRLSTVKNHVHNVLEKMRVSRRGEAAARVRATGFAGEVEEG